MISPKFKPGDKVYYDTEYNTNNRYRFGIVCTPDKVPAWDKDDGSPKVWAYWGEDTTPGYMEEDLVYSTEPKIKRNLPEWF